MKNRETDEWLEQNQKSTREFIRKWGHFCKHDALLKPIIPHKYDIGFIIKNCNIKLLESLEPWCSTIYMDNWAARHEYLYQENHKSSYDLNDKIKSYDSEKNNEILVTINGKSFNQQDFQYIQQLSEILEDSGEPAFHGELGNLIVEIFEEINTFEKDLIICE